MNNNCHFDVIIGKSASPLFWDNPLELAEIMQNLKRVLKEYENKYKKKPIAIIGLDTNICIDFCCRSAVRSNQNRSEKLESLRHSSDNKQWRQVDEIINNNEEFIWVVPPTANIEFKKLLGSHELPGYVYRISQNMISRIR